MSVAAPPLASVVRLEELVERLEMLAGRVKVVAPTLFVWQAQAAFRLTPQEQAVVRGVALGFSNRWIGRWLGITERTANTHLAFAMRKMGVQHRTQAALMALLGGLVTWDEVLACWREEMPEVFE